MGTWRIEVTGHGCHHNKNPEIDADLAARDFVKTLRKQGHDHVEGKFQLTGGDPEDIGTDKEPTPKVKEDDTNYPGNADQLGKEGNIR